MREFTASDIAWGKAELVKRLVEQEQVASHSDHQRMQHNQSLRRFYAGYSKAECKALMKLVSEALTEAA